MKLYLRLAWRNIWRHRRRTIIVVSAIGLSLSLMMMYDGLAIGFEDSIYSNAVKILGGNVQVHAENFRTQSNKNPLIALTDEQKILDAARAIPEVTSASRRIITGGLTTNRKGAFSVSITGIEPELEQKVSLIAANISEGRNLTAEDQDVVLIGKGLADAMEVSVGDRITLAGGGLHNQTIQRTMSVIGIYDVGLPEIEKKTVYLSLNEAGYLYGLTNQSTEVSISLQNLGQGDEVIRQLQAKLPGYDIASWETNFPELGQALQSKGGVMNIFGAIVISIAGIGILNLLLMAVFERTREIGILGAMGMKPRQIGSLFVLEGTLMGIIGLVVGIVLGITFNGILGAIGIDYSSYSNVTEYTALITGRVYPTLGVENLLARGITVIVITVLSSLYPAHEASLKEPALALHTV